MNNWPCNWKCVPLPAHKPRLNRFCPDISFLGACAKSINYVLLLTNLWTTDPAIGSLCHYLPTSPVWTGFAQISPSWGLVPSQSIMCYCLPTYPQRTLHLDMSVPLPPTSPVWTGFAQISPYQLCAIAYKLMHDWPCNWKFVPLPAHKPRLNRFCPEISFLGACAESIKYVPVFLSAVGYGVLGQNECMSVSHRWWEIGLSPYGLLFRARVLGSPQDI